jgi:hypothetical protein
MIKKLIFMAPLLVPALAYGQNPSADLSVQVVRPPPTGASCGAPPVGAAAADTTAAGLSTCVLYNDFTTQIPNSIGTGIPNPWLWCTGGQPGNGTIWTVDGENVTIGGYPCIGDSTANASNSWIYQTTDTLDGKLALEFSSNGFSMSTLGGQGGGGYGVAAPNPGLYPYFYFETYARTTNPQNNVTNARYGNFAVTGWYSTAEAARNGATTWDGQELDFFEQGASVWSPAFHIWTQSQPVDHGTNIYTPPGTSSFTDTAYHTWGTLWLGNSSNVVQQCSYLDGVRLGCGSANETPWPTLYNMRHWIQVNGMSATYWKYFKVWSCANWRDPSPSGMCVPGSTPPAPYPIAITPASGSIADNVGSAQAIATFTVTMSDSSTFAGTTTKVSESYANPLASLSGLNLATSRGLSSVDDGTDNIMVQACQNGQCISRTYALTISSASGTIACDIGPAYVGTIPAGAAAAGFTTCAANYDFTQSSFSDTATWLDCAGASNPLWFNDPDTRAGGSGAPCSDVTMVTDSTIGKQVLKASYTLADYNGGANRVSLTTWRNNVGDRFPNSGYEEAVMRVDANTYAHPSTDNYFGDLWEEGDAAQVQQPWCNGLADQNCTWMEWDFIEMYSPGYNSNNGAGEHCGLANVPPCPTNGIYYSTGIQISWAGNTPNFDPTVFRNYGMRITQDGAGHFGACNYLDGVQMAPNHNNPSCGQNSYAAGSADVVQNAVNRLKIWSGSSHPANGVDNTIYVQRITVWTCSAWRTTPCNTGINIGTP